MSDCTQKMQTGCNPEVLKPAAQTGHAPVFSACLPFGGRLFSKGGFVNYEAPDPPDDGTYTAITIENGCIVGVGHADISMYTTAPCAPIPCDCGGGSSSVSISASSANLTKLDPTGAILTTLSVTAGDGIVIAGNGTSSSPFVISSNPSAASSVYIKSGNSAIIVEGSGTQASPFTISHAVQTARNINGMTFDRYGHLTGYTERTTAGTINGVIGEDGINVQTDVKSGIATVGLSAPLHALEGEYMLGGYNVEFDEFNRVYSIERQITVSNATYRLGRYDVNINSYGSITDITPLANNVVDTPICHHATSASDSVGLTFELAQSASLKIEVEAKAVPATLTVSVDGRAATGALVSAAKYMALTQAIYAAGQHTVTISGAITADTFITVTPVTAL